MLQKLIDLKQKIAETVGTGIGVDIDETLSWTVGFWFKEMSSKFGNPEELDTETLIKEYKYTFNVPYWQKSEAEAWIESKRNSNKLQEQLPIIPEANDYLNSIAKKIPVVAYITGRPETVEKGTRTWLNKHHFPKAEIITRPAFVTFNMNNMWRARMLELLYPEVSIYIDDNPGLIYHLSDDYKGKIVLYGFDKPINSKLDVVVCKDWKAVHDALA